MKVSEYINETLYVKRAWESFWTCNSAEQGQMEEDRYNNLIAQDWSIIKTYTPLVVVATAVLLGAVAYGCYRKRHSQSSLMTYPSDDPSDRRRFS